MTDTGESAHYLEVAPENVEIRLRWSTATNRQNVPNVAGTSQVIGSGRQNTALILAVDVTAPAALACRNLSNNRLNDWFLPSRNELNQLYRNRVLVGNLETGFFWSSSQYNFGKAFAHYIEFNIQYEGYKDNVKDVRPVRAF